MKNFLKIFFLISISFQGTALAETTQVNSNPVKFEANFISEKIIRGEKNKFLIELNVAPHHHAYGDMLKLVFTSPEGAKVGELKTAPIKSLRDKFSGKMRDSVEGKASIRTEVFVPEVVALGKQSFTFKFTYQACSEEYCLFPKTTEIKVNVNVVAGSNEITDGKTVDLPKPQSERPLSNMQSPDSFEDALSKGVLWTFLFVFIAGFLTSLTPCVLPMIPITMSIIGATSAQVKRVRGFSLSFTYVLGIALTYSTLGVVAALTGQLFGSALSHPSVILFVAAVFVVMGISMWGHFEIQVPAFIRNKLGGKQTAPGYIGAFVAGLFSGIVASPCIGPVLVGILTYVGQTRNALFGFGLLFTFAMGLGVLFMVLGTFSSLVSKIPRRGPWMVRVKKAFGVMFFLMAAFYVWPLVKAKLQVEVASHSPGLVFNNYSQNLLNENAAGKKLPVIVDFYADWCVACKELEKFTYTDQRVIEAGEKFLLLKIDATQDSQFISELKNIYKVVGLPTVLFIDGTGRLREDLTVTGFVKADIFLDRMGKASQK